MGLIPNVTCRRCKREYSALRGRCPHCGTRKVKQSERTPATTAGTKPGTSANNRMNSNAKWQLIFGLILVAAVILAVIVLIVVSTNDDDPAKPTPTIDPSTVTSTPLITAPPTLPPEPTVSITSITISYYNDPKESFTAKVGESDVPLTATVYPLDANAVVTWSSTDESVIKVSSDGVVTAIGSGTASVIAECGGIKAECQVWVP